MRKLRTVGGLILAVILVAASASLISAGGPVINKSGINDPDPGYGRTMVIAANKHPSSSATVKAAYYFMGGYGPIMGPVTKTSNSNGKSDVFDLPNGIFQDWRGTLDLEADQPLATVSQMVLSQNAGGAAIAAAAYAGTFIGATTIYFPWVVYEENVQFSQLLVMNMGSNSSALRFEYFEDGVENTPLVVDTSTLLGYPGAPVPDANLLRPFEAKVFDLHIPGTMMPEFTPGAVTKWQGSVKVTSLNGQPLAGVANNHWADRVTAYNGLNGGSVRNYVPSLERRVSATAYSAMRLQCIASDADGDCDTTIELITIAGDVQTPLTCSIGQNRAKEINADGTVPGACGTIVSSSDWIGAATVYTSDSSQVGVISYTTRASSGMAQATNAIAAGDARKRVYLPDVNCKSLTSGTERYSIISIQNTSTTTGASVTTYYLGRNGAPNVQLTILIPASSVYRYNLKNCSPLGGGINTWAGSARVESSQPVAVVVENLWLESGKNWISSYTGIPCTETFCP